MIPSSMLQPSPISTTLAFSSRVVTFCIVAAILSISALVITVAVVGFPGLGWAPAVRGIRTAAVSKPVNAVLFIGVLLNTSRRELIAPPFPDPVIGDRVDPAVRRRKHSRFQAWGWRRHVGRSSTLSSII